MTLDSNNGTSTKKDSAFLRDLKQQRSSAWIPQYKPVTVSPTFIGFGILLIPLGVAVLLISSDTSSDIKEFKLDYTNCQSVANSSITCASYLGTRQNQDESHAPCQCNVQFELSKPMKGEKIYLHYSLENFHQNSRLYIRSKDDDQLLGKIGTLEELAVLSKDCEPYHQDSEGRKIIPCGAIANSMFNDSLQLYYNHPQQGPVKINQNRRGIAWSTDPEFKYSNPPEFSDRNHSIWEKFTKPQDWSRTIWDLDPEDPDNNGLQNEDFMVWMRAAAFSNFRKMYRIIETPSQDVLKDGLPAGNYSLQINYTYEVVSFGGRKGIMLSAPTFFGQKNYFQGISLISVGGFSTILGLLFLLCGFTTRHGKGSFSKSSYHTE